MQPRDSLLNRVDKLAPGDMPEFDTGLAMGRAAAGMVIDRIKNDGADNSMPQQ